MKEYRGYAVCDKENNSTSLKVYCSDLLPFQTGSLDATTASANVVDNGYQGEVKEANYLVCEYRDDSNGHSMFPPDIRKGEPVRVYKLSDSEVYYWAPCGTRTTGNRKTETHRIGISATLDNDTTPNDDNSYFLEFDTRRSHSVTLSTSKADGEAFRYLFKIDADKNTVYLGDDVGNCIIMDSAAQSVTIISKSGATIQVSGNDTNTTCKGDLSMVVEGNVSQVVKGNVELSCDGNVTIKSKGAINLESKSAINLTAPTVSVNKGSTR